MADAVWPPSLPTEALLAGLEETPPDLRLRTDMDAGPAKVRRRFTAGVRVFSISLLLTRTQVATFDEFLLTTTEGGALPWTWKHPRTGNPIDFRFVELPRYAARAPRQTAGDLWSLSFTVEAMPGTEITGEEPEPPGPDEGLAMMDGLFGWWWGEDEGADQLEVAAAEEAPWPVDVLIFEAAPSANDDLAMFTGWYPIVLENDADGATPADEFPDDKLPEDAEPTAPVDDTVDFGGGVGGMVIT